MYHVTGVSAWGALRRPFWASKKQSLRRSSPATHNNSKKKRKTHPPGNKQLAKTMFFPILVGSKESSSKSPKSPLRKAKHDPPKSSQPSEKPGDSLGFFDGFLLRPKKTPPQKTLNPSDWCLGPCVVAGPCLGGFGPAGGHGHQRSLALKRPLFCFGEEGGGGWGCFFLFCLGHKK